ncbi:hypothetical protein BO70DRAFT_287341 [Aspergillus heteromorphus CBS 117.55]|uniref:Uncharacterized protein n=1 Tax=Aspergillus heteromorphus CBS 117.55 TaxID=1448321 RepID=A0A317WPX0_9EURO|nr:uncharacterized protein BO70DRAFT_287341 [Aspergillus heteromorphus CBS 117.55]PWY87701.1 hypothetical protein BO70DRAFT_287341 [Aspergillus heteromorphus CBS 117.55]
MPVSPRASKEEFMAALGLSTHDPQHEQYYRAMRDEAIQTYNTLNEDPSNLLESIRTDHPGTKPPYFWHHIRPERQRWAITEISRNAGLLTRALFDRGNTAGEYGPNWVAGWLLYSVFRSRDVRNNRNRRKGGSPPRQLKPQGDGSGSGGGNTSGKKEYYDPVRNG